MRRTDSNIMLLLALLAAAGCQAGRVDLPGVLPAGRAAHAARPDQAEPEGIALPPGPLTRGALKEWVLGLGPPRLAAASHRYREGLGRLGQAELWPNPSLMVRKEMVEGTPDPGKGQTKIELSQRIELGGKRGARTAQAAAEAEVLHAEFQDQVLEALKDAQIRFFELLRLQEECRLAREEQRLAEDLAGLARSRQMEGRITTQELRKFEVAAARARLTVTSLERDHERSCRALEGALGLPAGRIEAVQGAWPAAAGLPAEEDLDAGLGRHPRLISRARALAAAGLALERRHADAWPDLTLMLLGMRDHRMDEEYYGFGFGLDLPLFDRNQGLREEALAGRSRASSLLAQERFQLTADLREAATDYLRNAALLEEHDREIVPRVEEAYELTELAFEAGRSTYLDVLDSLLLLVASRRERLAYLEGLARAAAALEYLGGPALQMDAIP